MDLPIKNGGSFHSEMLVYQRVVERHDCTVNPWGFHDGFHDESQGEEDSGPARVWPCCGRLVSSKMLPDFSRSFIIQTYKNMGEHWGTCKSLKDFQSTF